MSIQRKLLFMIVTMLVLAASVEGVARFIWWRLESRSLGAVKAAGEKALRTDSINYMKQPSELYGYTLKPSYVQNGAIFSNAQGFAQKEFVPIERQKGYLRIIAQGESTTQGLGGDQSYPSYLRQILNRNSGAYKGVEVINAGVCGWTTKQVALRAENQLAQYRPDIVLLYTGWNDFHIYDPFYGGAPASDCFDKEFNNDRKFIIAAGDSSKAIALLSACYQRLSSHRKLTVNEDLLESAKPSPDLAQLNSISSDDRLVGREKALTPASLVYRFYLENLNRIVAAYRAQNPKVQIVLCTLVGRWPYESEDVYLHGKNESVWWMQDYKLSLAQSISLHHRFNSLIKDYGKQKGLVVLDLEKQFNEIHSDKLQWDFCHFTNEGYELLAESMYEQLRETGVVNGKPDPRLANLQAKYTEPSGVTGRQVASKTRNSGT